MSLPLKKTFLKKFDVFLNSLVYAVKIKKTIPLNTDT